MAMLWVNGIRAGFQMDEIEKAMAERGAVTKKFEVERQIDMKPKEDADIKPVVAIAPVPKIKASGETAKADPRSYECAFPEVTAERGIGYRIIKKTPMKPGEEGVAVDGTILTVEAPTDKDLSILL